MTTPTHATFVVLGDIIEENGRTIRENNLMVAHKFPLGTLVKITGKEHFDEHGDPDATDKPYLPPRPNGARLYVVEHLRDCDGTPLYRLSLIPVVYPHTNAFTQEALAYRAIAQFCGHGYGEDGLADTGHSVTLHPDLHTMFFRD
jgi:hypothetical protein